MFSWALTRPYQQLSTSRYLHFYRISPSSETVWATRAKTAQCKVASCMQWNKTKLPKHYQYYFFFFFTSCLNSTVSLPSSSFVLTKDILTQVRKPPENFQLEYELSQSFMNFAFSGLKGKKIVTLFTKLSTAGRRSDLGTSNFVPSSFYSPPAKLNTSKALCVVMFSLMVALHWCILNCRGLTWCPTTLEVPVGIVLPHRECGSAHLSPPGQKGAEPGPQETTHHHAGKQETAGRA